MLKVVRAPLATSRAGRLVPSAGFSLTELLVVLALVSLAGGIAASTIRSGREGQNTRAAVADLANALRQARARAISGAGQTRVTLDLKERQYIWTRDKPPKRLPEDAEILFSAVAQEVTNEKTAAIRFYEDGASSGGEIVLTRRGQSWTILVNWLTGAVTVRDRASLPAGG